MKKDRAHWYSLNRQGTIIICETGDVRYVRSNSVGTVISDLTLTTGMTS